MGERVALYARVSTADQEAEPQLERLRGWAEQRGLEVVGEFSEVASGADGERAEFRRLHRLARGGRFHHVAVTKVDRWARSVRDLANSIEELDAAHVRFHAVDQGLSFNRQDPMGKAVAQVVGILAELEANLISARTKEMLEAKGQPGGRPTKACAVCSGEREGGIFAKVSGTKRPVCKECKLLEPARRRELFSENQEGEDGDAG